MTTFADTCRAYGLIVDSPVANGKWQRVRTEDKPHKKNGSYIFDGHRGALRNYATMDAFVTFKAAVAEERDFTHVRNLERERRRKEAARRERAKQQAFEMIRQAVRVIPNLCPPPGREVVRSHPYLVAKGFPAQSCLVFNGSLVIPMYSLDGELVGAQTIAEDGKKLFIPGTRAKGAVHRLGTASETWLVEGYATGLSVERALRRMYRNACVVVCFSAGNLVEVSTQICRSAFVVADNDASGTGEKAALDSGLPFAMPPIEGMDANDYEQKAGLQALVTLMRAAMR